MFNRFPSEIGEVSSLEFLKFEELMYEEKERADEARRQSERDQMLRRM